MVRYAIRPAAGLVLLLLPPAVHGQANEWEQVVLDQLEEISTGFREHGYVATGQRFTGALDAGGTDSFELPLVAGAKYVVAAACDGDCSNIDLYAFDAAGREVSSDVEDDDYPVVAIAPEGRGARTFTLRLDMVECASGPCSWGVDIFVVQDDAPPPPASAPPPPVAAAKDGRLESGTLRRGDRTLTSGEYADYLTLEGRAGEYLLLDLTSREFDPYLILIAPSGEQFENDDYEGSASRSLLGVDLTEDGEYQVVVTTYDVGEGGAYDLKVEARPGRPAGGRNAWTEKGTLAEGDSTLTTGEFLDDYEVEGVPGQRLRLDMKSSDFDTYLILIDPAGEHVENDDAADLPGHSVIDTELKEAGTYQVLATSYAKETGAYELSFELGGSRSAAERRQQDVVRLTVGARQSGALEPGDATLEGGELSDRYVFEGQAGQGIVVEMSSRDFDTYLGLLLPDGKYVENDDEPGQTGVSKIELALPQDGRYQIIATSYQAGESGRYDLSLQGLRQAPSGPVQRPAPDGGRVLALLVGISDYQGDEDDLAYTADDAVRVRDALLRGPGMRPEDGILLTDSQATVGNFKNAVTRLASRMRPTDLFVLFYSGHGGRLERSSFQPSDPDSIDETISLYDGELRDDDLAALLDQVPAGLTLLVLDSCFSGGFAKDVISAPNRMGLFSSEEDVTSQVAAKFRAGGYLSVFLADAIGDGYADDGDGELTAIELSQYLYERYRSDVKSRRDEDDFVRTGGPQLGYQHLVVDRGSITPYQRLFRLSR